MLDLFTIFTQGGLVLWYFQGPAFVGGDPINGFIQDVLVEGKGATADTYAVQNYGIKYRIDAGNNLVFAAVFNKSVESESGYINNLLDVVKNDFTTRFKEDLKAGSITGFDYANVFNKAYKKAQEDYEAEHPGGMRSFEETDRFAHTSKGSNTSKKAREELRRRRVQERAAKMAQGAAGGDGGSEGELSSPEDDDDGDEGVAARSNAKGSKSKQRDLAKVLKNRGTRGRRGVTGKKSGSSSSRAVATTTAPPPRSKTSTRAEPTKKVRIDFSDGAGQQEAALDLTAEEIEQGRREAAAMAEGVREVDFGFDADADEGDEELMGQDGGGESTTDDDSSSAAGSLFSLFRKITGTSELTKETVQPVLDQMQRHLMAKNVAADVAEKLCASVGEKLVGRSKGTFTTVKSVVKQALEESLTQILSPKRHIDILRDAKQAKQEGRPYSVVFCGVNGVGKSTNLSKIAFWLLSNNMRIMIAACDTFRSGAVEQLRTHCRKLRKMLNDTDDANPRVIVYDRGYGRNDAEVAADALRIAKSEKYDVVLIDTAGRMQDNEPLMRSLTQLIRVNRPDLVLFVGEALVGNEAVDQLTKFNRALQDFSEEANPRVIDGILLTKFDTVDDKVGSSISMTYITGQPIVFVGTGQHYFDLRKLNVRSVVSALLKPVQR